MDEIIEQLASQLAVRADDSLSFSVTEPENPPQLRELARLINQYGIDVSKYISRESQRQEQRAGELMQAYNALQSQTEEMGKELTMARGIQEKLLPQGAELPDREEIRAAGYYAAMSKVGGDLYDIIRVGRNAYGVLIADVSGHGIPAALVTALVKISFRSKLHWGVQVHEVCAQVNAELYPILNDLDYFVTAFFGVIDLEKGTFSYTNCGHHEAILMRESADDLITLDSRGKFLGVFEDAVYESKSMELESGDILLLYTDGILEARNLLDEEYGLERLFDFLMQNGMDDPEPLVKGIVRNFDNFCMGAAARDDQSIFAVRIYGTTDESGNEVPLPEQAAVEIETLAADSKGSDPVALLIKGLAAAVECKDWDLTVSTIRSLAMIGKARQADYLMLGIVYYRAGKFAKAREAVVRGLDCKLEASASIQDRLEKLQRRIDAA